MSLLTLPSYAYSIIQQELLICTALACMMGALWNECMNEFTLSRKRLLHGDGNSVDDRVCLRCVHSYTD